MRWVGSVEQYKASAIMSIVADFRKRRQTFCVCIEALGRRGGSEFIGRSRKLLPEKSRPEAGLENSHRRREEMLRWSIRRVIFGLGD
jgi:hypothetical protein